MHPPLGRLSRTARSTGICKLPARKRHTGSRIDTEAEYDGIRAAYEAGFTHAAHFYNAMPGFHKRREYKYEGTVESVYLTDGMTIELIADGIHLPSTILKLAYKLKGVEHTCLVTDALSCAATEGKEINNPRYIIEDGVCKLADRSSLAGSMRHHGRAGAYYGQGGYPVGRRPAHGFRNPGTHHGRVRPQRFLQKDKDADILIMDKELNIRAVWQAGKLVQENFLNYK